ncbi:DUF5715 family protein [Porphyromonas endodontalis]|uniref:DUF5715 family protein n=1 Tax=Porphyromonas endodontalis TaxID=28124 RepID=UPI00288B006B|nr:DUF5715 family protein [Porphyromonas endodontalis]
MRATLLRWGVALKKAGSLLWHYYLVLEGAFLKAMRWVGKKIAPLFAFTQKINLPFLSSVKAFFRKLFAPLAPYKEWIYRSFAWCGIVLVVVLIGVTLGNNRNKITPEKSHINTTTIDYAASFNLDYGKTFNDENPVHIEAAQRFGIVPIADSASRAKALDAMVEIFTCDRYKVDSLEHSIPYLVPEAKDLLDDLGADFAETLKAHHLPPYKFIITSVTRTLAQRDELSGKNVNAAKESSHCYGTTIDISWKRFDPITKQTEALKEGSSIMLPQGSSEQDEASEDKTEELKRALASLLHQYRAAGRCLVKYERKQACFHITVDCRRPSLKDFARDAYETLLQSGNSTQESNPKERSTSVR